MDREKNFYYCNPVKVFRFLEAENLSGKLSGVLGFLINEFILPPKKHFNKTLKFLSYPGFGERIDKTDFFTGCLGQVQSKQSDAILALFDYPMDVVNVSQGHIIYEERVGYVGSFPPAEFQPYEFSKTVEEFDKRTWMTIISFLIAFRILIWIKYKVAHKKLTPNNLTFQLLAHFTRDGQMNTDGPTMKVISMVLAVFSLLIFAILCSLLRTGLVVAQSPKILVNYDDIIKHNVKPSFMRGFYEHRYFKYAENGTDENKLWKWAVDKFGEDDLMLLAKPVNLINGSLQIANYKRVLFGFTDVLETLRSTLCSIIDMGEESMRQFVQTGRLAGVKEDLEQFKFQTYIRYGKNMKSKIKQVILADKEDNIHTLRRYLLKLHEFGFIRYSRDQLQKLNMVHLTLGDDAFGKKLRTNLNSGNCMLSHPVDEDRSVDDYSFVPLNSLVTCFNVCCYCLLSTNCFLVYELVKAKWASRKIRQRHLN